MKGGASRIGREICLALSSQHYSVLIHYRSGADQAERTKTDCLGAGASMAETICCDFDVPGERAGFIGSAASVFGRVDLLVNNASTFNYDDVRTFTEGKCFGTGNHACQCHR
ncbi:SDR family NAD(P)-dependent oxidoreductase [Rhodoferax antarcticus]|uniref:SDR family NAD(P)-dependent oxidoreductase n=1 Tax=Rhodoferax antarcticus TaxID=81479 RepID=UPI00094F8D1A